MLKNMFVDMLSSKSYRQTRHVHEKSDTFESNVADFLDGAYDAIIAQ
nr:protein [Spodoptera litura nucleopolyhedrovirus]